MRSAFIPVRSVLWASALVAWLMVPSVYLLRIHLSGWKCANPCCDTQQMLWNDVAVLNKPLPLTEIEGEFTIDSPKITRQCRIVFEPGEDPVRLTTYRLDWYEIYRLYPFHILTIIIIAASSIIWLAIGPRRSLLTSY